MHYRTLNNSHLRVSLAGYGSWALSKRGWKGVNQQEAINTFHHALHRGINFIDTAPIYGFGKSEEILGNEIKQKRDKLIIATKCGLVWDDRGRVNHDLGRAAIERDIAASLKRLKTDYIDLYQVHWPDKSTPLEETFSTLNNLIKKGMVRYLGVCNFPVELIKQAMEFSEIISVQDCYNYLQRDVEEAILPFCRDKNLSFIGYSPFAQGLLTNSIKEDYTFGKNDIRALNPLFKDRALFQKSLHIKKDLGKKPSSKALDFLINGQHCSSILMSVTKIAHLDNNLRSFG